MGDTPYFHHLHKPPQFDNAFKRIIGTNQEIPLESLSIFFHGCPQEKVSLRSRKKGLERVHKKDTKVLSSTNSSLPSVGEIICIFSKQLHKYLTIPKENFELCNTRPHCPHARLFIYQLIGSKLDQIEQQ